MKPREEGGVVDGRLNVFGKQSQLLRFPCSITVTGTQNLKVVDLSICPVSFPPSILRSILQNFV
jgi:alcohol oxidase